MTPRSDDGDATQKRVPNKVKDLRLERGLSQAALADLTNCSLRTINRIENGNEASDLVKTQIAKALQQDIDAIFQPTSFSNQLIKAAEPVNLKNSWHDRLLQRGPYHNGPILSEHRIRSEFVEDGKITPALARLQTLLEDDHYNYMPVICGEFGSGKTSLAAFLASALSRNHHFETIFVPVENLILDHGLITALEVYLNTAHGEGAWSSLAQRNSRVFLVLDGLEAFAFSWSSNRLNRELDNFSKFLSAHNFQEQRLFSLGTCNDIFAREFLKNNPNFYFFWLQSFTLQKEGETRPYLDRWWKLCKDHYLLFDSDMPSLEVLATEDYGRYPDNPISNAFLARMLKEENYRTFKFDNSKHRSFMTYLHRREWYLSPRRLFVEADFFIFAELLARTERQGEMGITHDKFLATCLERNHKDLVARLQLTQRERFYRAMCLLPIAQDSDDRLQFRVSGLCDWLFASSMFRGVNLKSFTSVDNVLSAIAHHEGFELDPWIKIYLRQMVTDAAPEIGKIHLLNPRRSQFG